MQRVLVLLAILLTVMSCIVLSQVVLGQTRDTDASGSRATPWPTRAWAKAQPSQVGLDEKILSALDTDLGNGKYSLVDSLTIIRCGTDVFEKTYSHDYEKIYAKEAKTRGPLNQHLTGSYNYFDPAWHPYYHGTGLHSTQSVSKTTSSIILGIAITRGDSKSSLDTPLLKYFDAAKVKNVDDRKRRITLRHVLTMTTGLDWNEEVAYDDSKKRFQPDGGNRRLGAVRDRPPHGAGTWQSLQLQQRRIDVPRLCLPKGNGGGHREIR